MVSVRLHSPVTKRQRPSLPCWKSGRGHRGQEKKKLHWTFRREAKWVFRYFYNVTVIKSYKPMALYKSANLWLEQFEFWLSTHFLVLLHDFVYFSGCVKTHSIWKFSPCHCQLTISHSKISLRSWALTLKTPTMTFWSVDSSSQRKVKGLLWIKWKDCMVSQACAIKQNWVHKELSVLEIHLQIEY